MLLLGEHSSISRQAAAASSIPSGSDGGMLSSISIIAQRLKCWYLQNRGGLEEKKQMQKL